MGYARRSLEGFIRDWSPGAIMYRRVAREIADEITDDFYAEFDKVMDNFYGTYSPQRYRRTLNLWQTGQKINRANGYKYNTGGIIIDSANAPMVYASYKKGHFKRQVSITTDNVLQLMWWDGIRGLPMSYKGYPAWYEPHRKYRYSGMSPADYMEKKFYPKYISDGIATKHAQEIANKYIWDYV